MHQSTLHLLMLQRRKKRINGEATLRYIYKLPKDTQQQQQSPSPLPSTIQSTPRVQHQSPQSGAYQSGPRATQSPGLISHNQTQILPQPGSQVHNSVSSSRPLCGSLYLLTSLAEVRRDCSGGGGVQGQARDPQVGSSANYQSSAASLAAAI